MEFKGTKGEWKTENIKGYPRCTDQPKITVNGCLVSQLGGGDCEEVEANAKLIAAAPLLLKELISIAEACKGNVKHSTGVDKQVYTEIYQTAEKAIEKALK